MRKVVALCLLGSLGFFVMVCADSQSGTVAQEQPTPVQFGFESDSMSMEDIGAMLEQFAAEMRQDGGVTYRGEAYSFTGYGGIEFSLNRRVNREGNVRAGFEVGFSASGPRDQGLNTGAQYYGTQVNGPPAQVADYLDAMVANLASSGTFQLDFYTSEFVGSAIIDQRLIEHVERNRARRTPFSLETFVTFGEGEVERHDDDEDYVEDLEAERILPLGVTETVGADQATVAEVISSLAASLRSGTIQVADGEAEWGDNVRFSIAHLAPGEEGSQKIEMVVRFGPVPPPPTPEERAAAQEGPRYYVEEAGGTPMAEFAAMLQRIASEILEDGTFTLDGQEFTVGDELRGGEISFNANGIGIEVSWNPPGSG